MTAWIIVILHILFMLKKKVFPALLFHIFKFNKIINMKTVFVTLIVVTLSLIISYFISVKFYLPLMLLLGCFLIIITYTLFKDSENRIKILLLTTSLAYITLSLTWPKYIALHPPGLPPIGIQRLANLLAISSFAFAMFCSNWFKKEIARSFNSAKAFWIFFGVLVFFRFASVFVSPRPFSSMYVFMSDLFVHWFFIFAGVVIGSSHRNFILFSKIIAFSFFINFLFATGEFVSGRNLFFQFVNASDPTLEWVMAEKTRSSLYRAQSVFLHPISFAEFASIGLCFAIFMLLYIKNIILRYTAIFFAVLCASSMVILSGSRSGYVAAAIVISLAAFSPLANSLFRKKMNLKTTALWSFLIIVVAMAVSILGVLVYDYTFGKYAYGTVDSTSARLLMLERSFDRLIESPIIGHGVALGAELVGIETNRAGSAFTIDSLFISYVVESGLFAVASFTALIIIGAFKVFKAAFLGREENWFMLFTIGLSIIASALFKSILSIPENNFLLFVILGISVSEVARNNIKQKIIRGERNAL
jgi:hypothetical protein